jgi:hypothetical protein
MWIFWHIASLSKPKRSFYLILAGLAAVAIIREFDWAFDWIWHGFWKIPFIFVSILFIYLAYLNKKNFYEDAATFLTAPECGILFSGFLIVIIFSRMIGCKVFWEAIMGGNFDRSAKNIAEESIETIGYFIILISAIEHYIRIRFKQ